MTEGHYPANAPWADPGKTVELVGFLASGAADALSGRSFHAERDDIGTLIAHAQEIIDQDSNVVRLRELKPASARHSDDRRGRD
jgi:hypothetical protein